MSSPNLSNLPLSLEEKTLPDVLDTPAQSHVVVLLSCLAQPHPKLTEDRVGGGVFLRSSVRKGEPSEKSTRQRPTGHALTLGASPRRSLQGDPDGLEFALDAKTQFSLSQLPKEEGNN